MRPSVLVLCLSFLAAGPLDAQKIKWKGDLQPITAEQLDAFLRVATIEANAREAAWRAQPVLMTALRQQRCIQSFEARAEKLSGPPERYGEEDDPDDSEDNIKRLNRDITAKCGVRYPEQWKESEQLMPLTNWQPLDAEKVRELGYEADYAGQAAAEGKGGLSSGRYAMLKERLNAWYVYSDSGSFGDFVYDAAELAVMKSRLKEIAAVFARINDIPMIQ